MSDASGIRESVMALPPFRQRGYILLPVILLITMVATVAFMLNHESALDGDITDSIAESVQARYVAEAGLQHAIRAVQDSSCAGSLTVGQTSLGANSYQATVTAGVTSTAYTLSADQDTWLKESAPSEKHGNDFELSAKNTSGDNMRTLYRFDITAIPAGAQVGSATAWLYVTGNDPDNVVNIHEVTTAWDEATADWTTTASQFDSLVIDSIPAQASNGIWVQVNITSLVQGWVNGSPNNGIMLLASPTGNESKFTSREWSTGSERPRLEVVATSGPASPVTITATGTLAGNPSPANDITRTLTRTAVTAYQSPSLQVFQPGAARGQDAYIWEWDPGINYGSDDETWVASTPPSYNRALSLFRFDVDALPPGARILDARLSLHHRSGNDPDVPVTAHRITQSWDEQFVTWSNRDFFFSWNNAGGDIDSMVMGTTNVGPASMMRYEWDITGLVQGWVNGTYPNYGVALRTEQPSILGERFDTSDHADPARHPRLSITFACECGYSCQVPQGAGNILFVVTNSWLLTDAETQKKTLFESWGYTVNLISQWDVSWNFNNKAASNDVVYVSKDVDATQAGMAPVLAATSLGLINEKGQLNDDLGISGGLAKPVGTDINVADNSHYITQIFPLGNLQIFDKSMTGMTTAGGDAAGLQALADWGGAAAVAVLDSGAALQGGGTAPGRRVMLPIGKHPDDFNLRYLNNNGRLIMQRAIQWGSGITAVAPPPKLLLVVVDPASLLVQEAAKKTLVESWGYTVSLIDEADSQANFDAAVADNDVVYITEDVASGTVGTKLVNATIGVVTEEANLSDEFGFSDGIAWGSGVEIQVDDNTHYITQPFAGGNLTILTASEALAYLTPGIAPDAAVLGRIVGGLSLTAVDAGADLIAGRTAAGRRVRLPWGGNDFDVNHLNADGLTILQRAIDWGAGAGTAAVTAPVAHWTFDEGSGSAALDSVGGNDATLNGGTSWTTGTINGALAFDGSGDYIRTDSNFTPPPVGTVTFWMQVPGSPSSHGRIIGLADTWEIRHVTTGTTNGIPYGLVFDLGVTGTNNDFVTTTTIDTPGQWYHVAASYDTTSDAYAVYIDGVPHKSGTYPSALSLPAAGLLSMGTRTGSTDYFDGVLDDVRVYDKFLSAAEIAAIAADGGGGGGGTPPTGGVVFEEFTDAKLGGNGSSLVINKPAGTVAGDLLIAAVATDGNRISTLAPPAGWTVVDVSQQGGAVTLGVWWKLAGASESADYTFTWTGNEKAYGMVMRFTGHDPASPINVSATNGGTSGAPTAPAVTTTVTDTMILRLGGFDDDDITVGNPGLSGHAPVSMDKSSNGNGTASAGAGYLTQAAVGDSGTADFLLSASEQYRTVTLSIAPAP